jgi:hypothetical protein
VDPYAKTMLEPMRSEAYKADLNPHSGQGSRLQGRLHSEKDVKEIKKEVDVDFSAVYNNNTDANDVKKVDWQVPSSGLCLPFCVVKDASFCSLIRFLFHFVSPSFP